MIKNAKWITAPIDMQNICLSFVRQIKIDKPVKKATLNASAVGVYKVLINGKKIGNSVLMPGWTSYKNRIQYQTYDITDSLYDNIKFEIICGSGWAVGYMGYEFKNHFFDNKVSVIFSIDIDFEDGTSLTVISDENTDVFTTEIIYSEIYHGETIDRTAECKFIGKACIHNIKTKLIPQQGEIINEHERIMPVKYIITPKNERVIDFGQNMTGYVEIHAKGKKGDRIKIRHAEILDKNGNFYTENLRSAKQTDTFVLGSENEIFKPSFTFHGFRYICIDEYPSENIDINDFTAIVVHSDIKRTGNFICGNEKINQLYSNVIWGQKSNYLDIPTDCPQRDERLGWTGDAQVFVRTAAINYDVEKFFTKWLSDVALEQRDDGAIYGVVPTCSFETETNVSAGWGDAAVICPWQIYLAYGNKEILARQFDSMKKWVDYMHNFGDEEYLWLGGSHYGDWLGMDAIDESTGDYIGSTNHDFIASCYFAYSTSILIKSGKILGIDVSYYETLYDNISNKILETYVSSGIPQDKTQTACALLLYFNLTDNKKKTAEFLNKLVRDNGTRLTTGFIGTPYLLHALSDNGYTDTAYDLLMQEAFPSWLFSVNHGATTMWEHWDGVNENGDFWSAGMNSFNHYAYGAVFDWIFENSAGISTSEDKPGYRHILIKPIPDKRLKFVDSSIMSRAGLVESKWKITGEDVRFEFNIPEKSTATIQLPSGKENEVSGGKYVFIEKYI